MDEQDGTGELAAVLPERPAERLLHSDPHDFAGLYIRHRSSFTLHARRYLRDQRDADEVVQEAFLRLFLALPELDTELQALAYCRPTITNLCIDRFRAQARRPYLVDLDSVPVDVLVDDDPGDPVVRAEDAALVRAALSMLSPLHRAALVKREIEEKPLPVIAAELDIPEESVKHLLFRARRALRKILAESSLAPGGDGQLSAALAKAVSRGGMAVVAVLLAAIGLGTGPDLRAIPVLGRDLPDLPSVTEIAASIGKAFRDAPASDEPSDPSGGEAPPAPDEPDVDPVEPLVVPVPSSSPTAPASAPATATVGTLPVGPILPAPPSPSTDPSPSADEPSPSASAAPEGSQEPSPRASEATPQSSPTAVGPLADGAKPASAEPSPSSSPETSGRKSDPSSWDALPDGLGWAIDPSNPSVYVLVPVGPDAQRG
ncbi:MAG: polymerase subunit sigma-24 [Frankiales bacterium]|nr:polymerase subunit sigma-24 [Frankiales bacterium]